MQEPRYPKQKTNWFLGRSIIYTFLDSDHCKKDPLLDKNSGRWVEPKF
jgi:hypothetical protein